METYKATISMNGMTNSHERVSGYPADAIERTEGASGPSTMEDEMLAFMQALGKRMFCMDLVEARTSEWFTATSSHYTFLSERPLTVHLTTFARTCALSRQNTMKKFPH
jgi:hypothetical protein